MISTPSLERSSSFLLYIYATAILVLFGTHLDLFLERMERLPSNPIQVFVAAASLLFAWCAFTDAGAGSFYRLLNAVSSSATVLICFVVWIAGHVLLLGTRPLEANIDFTLIFPVYQLLIFFFGMALGSALSSDRLLRLAAGAAALTLATTILWDAFAPGTFSVDAGRAAGFAMNANVASFVLMLLVSASIVYDRVRVVDALLLAVALCAIFFTFSRGGLLLFGVVASFHVSVIWLNDRTGSVARRLATLAGCLGLGLVLTATLSGQASISNQPEAARRLTLFEDHNIVEGGKESRIDLFFHYLTLAEGQPVSGYGTGAVNSFEYVAPWGEGPHNTYLRAWIDHGLWGLVSYAGLLLALTALFIRRRCWAGVSFTMLISINGIFSHNVPEDKAVLILAGALLALATNRVEADQPA
jgi:O-antigen ligase